MCVASSVSPGIVGGAPDSLGRSRVDAERERDRGRGKEGERKRRGVMDVSRIIHCSIVHEYSISKLTMVIVGVVRLIAQ